MEPIRRILRMVLLVTVIAISKAQSITPSRQLDSLLQDYAYRAFVRPRTGRIYDAAAPANLTGVAVAALRLRCGSLRFRGVRSFKEFKIPTGVVVEPYVERLAFVYQRLGNWSSVYYPLPGYTYLTPVLGLLAYSAANLSATGLHELDIVASNLPITIRFSDAKEVPVGFTAKCVWFDLDGLPEFQDLVSGNVCSTYRQGHFAIVVNSTALAPAPNPSPSHKAKAWKIAVAAAGGFVGLVLLALLAACLWRYGKNKKVAEMERMAEAGESLQMARVGTTQAPVASGTRTQPILENEYIA